MDKKRIEEQISLAEKICGVSYNIVVSNCMRYGAWSDDETHSSVRIYEHVTLENITAYKNTGLLHFLTKYGELLVLPWWRIVSIEPIDLKLTDKE